MSASENLGVAVRDKVAIVGVGATDFSRESGRSELTLATQAVLAALDDAGLDARDVDGIVQCDMDVVRYVDLANSIGARDVTFWATVGIGGGAPCGMVASAVGALVSGLAETVVLYRALNGRSRLRFGDGLPVPPSVGGQNTYDEFFMPYGLTSPGQMYGLIARRHMIEFGTTQEQLGSIAVACRARANANPAAQMHDRPLTMADYLAARVIADPLLLNDFCLETDGACAVVLTTAERAKDCRRPPVLVRAVTQSAGSEPQGGLMFPVLMRETLTTQPSAGVAANLYRRAGLGPGDIDVAQLYDCFTITVLLQLEDYGFCAKGEGGPFAASGALELDGSLPINTAGGNLSEGYIHGMNHIVEGVRQLRGESTSPVDGAEVCLVTSGIPVTTSALILTQLR